MIRISVVRAGFFESLCTSAAMRIFHAAKWLVMVLTQLRGNFCETMCGE